jgi:predicted nucleotidyltransferase
VLILAKLSLEHLLTDKQIKVINELKNKIKENYFVYNLAVFGSVVRQEADEESDLDLLILIKEKATHKIRNDISSLVFEINLKYDTNISIVVLEKEKWEQELMKITPFYKEVQKDGVFLNEYL